MVVSLMHDLLEKVKDAPSLSIFIFPHLLNSWNCCHHNEIRTHAGLSQSPDTNSRKACLCKPCTPALSVCACWCLQQPSSDLYANQTRLQNTRRMQSEQPSTLLHAPGWDKTGRQHASTSRRGTAVRTATIHRPCNTAQHWSRLLLQLALLLLLTACLSRSVCCCTCLLLYSPLRPTRPPAPLATPTLTTKPSPVTSLEP